MDESLLAQQTRALRAIENLPRYFQGEVLTALWQMVGAWWREHGPDVLLLQAAASKANIDPTIARFYLVRPGLCSLERWRKRRAFRVTDYVSDRTSEENAQWLYAYAVYDMIHYHGDSVSHSFLLRQLDHVLPAFEIKQGIQLLKSEKLIESFHQPGKSARPILHYQIPPLPSQEPTSDEKTLHLVSTKTLLEKPYPVA